MNVTNMKNYEEIRGCARGNTGVSWTSRSRDLRLEAYMPNPFTPNRPSVIPLLAALLASGAMMAQQAAVSPDGASAHYRSRLLDQKGRVEKEDDAMGHIWWMRER